jgi:cation diffusion facilitator family transporter
MLNRILDWLGFGPSAHAHAGHHHGGHDHGDEDGGHGHTHGVVDPTLASTAEGIWAIKWSFAILAVTAIVQLAGVFTSGSIALFADAIHNVGDAATAIPLWIAFMLARRKPSATFTYGLGRVEDLAGIAVVLIILFSAVFAGYEAVDRLIHPQPVQQLGWLAAAGVIGFLGNEAVAVFRIRVGRRINSAALIADGYHARTDGLTSLAVVLGAIGVSLGFSLADPIIGLLITVAILGIVWQSARAVFVRMLDGVDPDLVAEIDDAVRHIAGVDDVGEIKARWIGHKLHVTVTLAVSDTILLASANAIAGEVRRELSEHIPGLAVVNVNFSTPTAGDDHHAPDPIRLSTTMLTGLLEIADTPRGERIRLRVSRHVEGLSAVVVIKRDEAKLETLALVPVAGDHHWMESEAAPAEPHEFEATLQLTAGALSDAISFRMAEAHHHHD